MPTPLCVSGGKNVSFSGKNFVFIKWMIFRSDSWIRGSPRILYLNVFWGKYQHWLKVGKFFAFRECFLNPALCLYLCSSKSNFYFTVLMLYLDKSVTSPANNITNVWNISKVLLGFVLENCDYLTFFSAFSFMKIYDSQDSSGRGRPSL